MINIPAEAECAGRSLIMEAALIIDLLISHKTRPEPIKFAILNFSQIVPIILSRCSHIILKTCHAMYMH